MVKLHIWDLRNVVPIAKKKWLIYFQKLLQYDQSIHSYKGTGNWIENDGEAHYNTHYVERRSFAYTGKKEGTLQ